MATEMKALITKLNPVCKKSLEAAASSCVQKTNFNVEIEHFLSKLCGQDDTDCKIIFKHYDIELDSLHQELQKTIERLKTGCTASPILSPNIVIVLEQAWMISSLKFGQQQIRSGAILQALIDVESLRGLVLNSCPLLLRIPRHSLKEDIGELLRYSPENQHNTTQAPLASTQEALTFPRPDDSGSQALSRYTINLTEKSTSWSARPHLWARS